MAKNELDMSNSTLAEAIDRANKLQQELDAAKAALAAKSNKSLEITMSDYGAGTVIVRGLNRFPTSLHPKQWERLAPLMGGSWVGSPMQTFIEANGNKLRIQRFAAAYAAKLGKKWPSGKSKTDPEAISYMVAYDAGKKLAEADPTLDVVQS